LIIEQKKARRRRR